ncbi:MAG TPA: nucleotide exchange factor GrpE [Candidatus Nitrosotalea sp.]|nr:nucleotide exchange factor GrpE [Candidatus Nitrosotalea sp.]
MSAKNQPNREVAETTEEPAPVEPVESGVAPDLDPRQLEELKAKAAKADEHWDRLLRVTADLENFKKRAARERQDALRYASEALLSKLVPILDNFDMALAAGAVAEGATVDSLRTGVSMIYNQFKAALAEAGLEEIDATGQPFNPNFHEAVSQEESNDVPEGQVIRQLRKGYRLRDRLIRPATVVVAKKPAA